MTPMPARRVAEPGQFGRVGLLLGGDSAEREVSLNGGADIAASFERSGIAHEVFDGAGPLFEAIAGGRAEKQRVIVEGFVEFDYEITLLTIRHRDGTSFCEPIGHIQVDGDYRESWQPQPMSKIALEASQQVAARITEALGGYGLFGVELFVRGDEVLFSEVSPRPHDIGMVTMISQDLSEFALHLRAITGQHIPTIRQLGPAASVAMLAVGDGDDIRYCGVEDALSEPDTMLRLFGKPQVRGKRRLGVALALGDDIDDARAKARRISESISFEFA